MAPSNFKAVIVGGGVSGLTLANLFEKLHIDYVLLESYKNVTPQVGASIAMLPHGQRILDQLGCLDEYLEGVPSLNCTRPTMNGKRITEIKGYDDLITQILGSGVAFNDRQVLLKVLYNNLKDKGKILVSKRVVKVSTTESGVSVETHEGETFKGDIVIGLDGIKSTVRDEMWRIAAEKSPGYFPKDEMKRVPIDYKCLFGIAKPHKAIPPGVTVNAMAINRSNLMIGGPGGKVYFFLFSKLPKRLYGDQAPRYSQDDARELAKQHHKDPIIDGCTFGDIFDNHISFGLTPLHEHVFAKWHFGRIITLGDAAHKPNPIGAQGGNSAIESVVVLANQLKRRLDRLPPSGRLSGQDIESIFKGIQATRNERAEQIVKYSRKLQTNSAPSGVFGMAMANLAPWIVSQDKVQESVMSMSVDAEHIDALPLPFRPHFIPWTDELPSKPLKSTRAFRVIVGLVLAALWYVAPYGLRTPELPKVVLGSPVREMFTGYPSVDGILNMVTRLFSLIIMSPNPEHRLQSIYFLPMLGPMILIWMVESHRRVTQQTVRGKWIMWPSIWALAYQLLSIARTGPVYFLVSLVISANPMYYRQTSRAVDPDVARALLPAMVLVYVLPTIFMLLPLWSSPGVWLDFITVWQVAPVLVGPAVGLLASGLRTHFPLQGNKSGAARDAAAAGREICRNRDLPYLLGAYSAVGFLAAILHVSAAVYGLVTPGISLLRTFFGLPSWPWSQGPAAWEQGMAAGDVAAAVFQWDLIIFSATLLVWCLFTVFDMRRVGYVTTAQAFGAAAGVACGLVLAGPGAMYAGTWYWREKTIAGLSKMEEERGEEAVVNGKKNV